MDMKKRIALIQLLSEELCDTAAEFEKAKESVPTLPMGMETLQAITVAPL